MTDVTLHLRIEYDEAVWSRLASTVADMREAAWRVPASRAGLDRAKLGWALDWADPDTEAGGGEQQQGPGGGLASGLVNNVANLALRKTDLWNFALFHEGNLHNNLFFKVRDRATDIQIHC